VLKDELVLVVLRGQGVADLLQGAMPGFEVQGEVQDGVVVIQDGEVDGVAEDEEDEEQKRQAAEQGSKPGELERPFGDRHRCSGEVRGGWLSLASSRARTIRRPRPPGAMGSWAGGRTTAAASMAWESTSMLDGFVR